MKSPHNRAAESTHKTLENYFASVKTNIGEIYAGFSSRGITMINLADRNAASFQKTYEKFINMKARHVKMPFAYARAIQQAAAGKAPGKVPIDLSGIVEYERKVLALLQQIPRGEVRPYSWLARESGRPRAARAVGNAMARNPVPLLIPCHRVVHTAGGIGKYGLGSSLKRDLLAREGAPVHEMEELRRKGIRYIGNTETRIYCFPTCKIVRRLQSGKRILLADDRKAAHAGFLPCRRCKPMALP
jgi:O-6-methylguanine DNA methyltransferase